RDLQGRPLSEMAATMTSGWQTVVLVVSYLPLLLWGPLLGVLTVAYWRRRTGAVPAVRSARFTRVRGS
ncbi:hypothetical protein ACFQ0D_37480, partial [Micromonospora zhanjiangensis]